MDNESFAMLHPPGRTIAAEPGILILDTNVVSVLEHITRGGFQPANKQHRQAAHLIRWLQNRPQYNVFPLYGALEGAGFHSGGISYYMVIRRSLAAAACIEYGKHNLDQLMVEGGGVPRTAATDMHVDFPGSLQLTVNLAEVLLPSTTLSCYVASLAIAKAHRSTGTATQKIEYVFERLVERLNYVPLFALYTAVLLFAGTPRIRNRLGTAFFKLHASDLRRSCMSAAWDLGYLQILSNAQAPALADLFDHRRPVVVTAERMLPEVTSYLRRVTDIDMGLRSVDLMHLDPSVRSEVASSLRMLQLRRVLGVLSAPDWQRCIRAAESLEEELSLSNVPPLQLEFDSVTVKAGVDDLLCFADSLGLEGMDVVNHFNQTPGDAIIGCLTGVAGIVADNACSRRRSEAETWNALLPRLRSPGSEDFPLGVLLTWASANTDARTFTALWQLIGATNTYGPTLIELWHVARTILADTAEARGVPREELIAIIQNNLRRSEYP